MNCQMMRVISSPSSSTTGFSTLIFAMIDLGNRVGKGRVTDGPVGFRRYSKGV
jgi:hypothetical protein